MMGNPCNATNFLGAEEQRGVKQRGGRRRREEGSSPFKPGVPSEEADNKEAAKVWELGGGKVERWVRWICQVDSSTQSFILAMT